MMCYINFASCQSENVNELVSKVVSNSFTIYLQKFDLVLERLTI